MVFLHNGGSDHHIWDRQIEFFSTRYTVCALDLLGFGESEKPSLPYTLDLYVDFLERFLAETETEPPVLAGNCIGASTALEYSMRHPGNVRALLLFHVCGGRPMLRESTGFGLRAPPFMKPFYLALFRTVSRVSCLQHRVVNRLFGLPPDPRAPLYRHLLETQRRAFHPASRWHLLQGLDSFNKFSVDFRPPVFLPPTCLFWGTMNKVLSLECGIALSRVLRPHRTHWIENAGHLAMSENPVQVTRLMQSFLDDIHAGRFVPS